MLCFETESSPPPFSACPCVKKNTFFAIPTTSGYVLTCSLSSSVGYSVGFLNKQDEFPPLIGLHVKSSSPDEVGYGWAHAALNI